MAEFRLLGPVEVWAAGRAVDVGQPRQRTVLAALLADAGRVVTTETLIDRLWGESPPAGARRALHGHIARVRRVLEAASMADGEPVRLVHRSGGYELAIEPDRVDLHRFRRLVHLARHPDCTDARQAALLRDALRLWRGQPLSGLPGTWAAQLRCACERQHLDAVVAWAQAELRIGNTNTVIGPAADLLGEHPLSESLAAVLMLALCAAGHTADALDCYSTTRRRLVDELGVEPGAELQAAHQTVLQGAVDVAPIPAGRRTPVPTCDVPAQLPPDVYGFVGRQTELARLDALAVASAEQPTAAVISVLHGCAGVGKTALAVHWAHRVADRFPDGQLYVNLRGFDPTGSAMSPSEALRGFWTLSQYQRSESPPALGRR